VVRGTELVQRMYNVMSTVVRNAMTAYACKRIRCGARKRSAVPLGAEKVRQVVIAVRGRLGARGAPGEGNATERLLLLRDVTFMSLLWNARRRGADVVRLNWEDVYVRWGAQQYVWGEWYEMRDPSETRDTEGMVFIIPRETKTEHAKRPNTISIARNCDRNLCCISWMILLYQLLGEVASGLCDGPMFRVVRGVWGRMSVQGMNNRLRKLLETYSRYEGETLHGIRRRSMQAAALVGESREQIMQSAGIITPDIVMRYLDVGRHLP
jgi:integrase